MTDGITCIFPFLFLSSVQQKALEFIEQNKVKGVYVLTYSGLLSCNEGLYKRGHTCLDVVFLSFACNFLCFVHFTTLMVVKCDLM